MKQIILLSVLLFGVGCTGPLAGKIPIFSPPQYISEQLQHPHTLLQIAGGAAVTAGAYGMADPELREHSPQVGVGGISVGAVLLLIPLLDLLADIRVIEGVIEGFGGSNGTRKTNN